ncbi:MAG: c-type cytochrome [Magnetococcales bacterium]|nr:c-type cytochrome [Magnetococcales bacterium]
MMRRYWVSTLALGLTLSGCLGWRPDVPKVDRAFLSMPKATEKAKEATPPFAQFAKAPWLGKQDDSLDAETLTADASSTVDLPKEGNAAPADVKAPPAGGNTGEGDTAEPAVDPTSPEGKKIAQSREMNREAFKFIQAKEYAQAEKVLEDALKLNPKNVAALTNMGVVYEKLNKPEMARKMYRKAILANPQALLKASDPNLRTGKNKKILDIILGEWNGRNQEKDEAMALKGDPVHGRKVYMDFCSEKCHQPNGWGDKEGKYPQVAGQYKDVIIKQLADIRSKNRDNPEMYRFSLASEIGGVQNVADVAAFIETMAMTDQNGKGPGTHLELGKKLFDRDCASCHGSKGEGDSTRLFELMYGQHYNYLVRQFQMIKEEKRRNGHPLMVIQVEAYTPDEITAVMDYISRLKVPDFKMRPVKQQPLPEQKSDDKTDKDSLL